MESHLEMPTHILNYEANSSSRMKFVGLDGENLPHLNSSTHFHPILQLLSSIYDNCNVFIVFQEGKKYNVVSSFFPESNFEDESTLMNCIGDIFHTLEERVPEEILYCSPINSVFMKNAIFVPIRWHNSVVASLVLCGSEVLSSLVMKDNESVFQYAQLIAGIIIDDRIVKDFDVGTKESLKRSLSTQDIRTSLCSIAFDIDELGSNSQEDELRMQAYKTSKQSFSNLMEFFQPLCELPAKVEKSIHQEKVCFETPSAPVQSLVPFQSQGNRNLSVLLIEDSISLQKVIGRFLARQGCDVYSVKNGKEGMSSVLTSDCNYDIILTDFCMPEMDGVQFLKEFKEYRDNSLSIASGKRQPYIIGMSATACEGELLEAFANDMDLFVHKPIQTDIFQGILNLLRNASKDTRDRDIRDLVCADNIWTESIIFKP